MKKLIILLIIVIQIIILFSGVLLFIYTKREKNDKETISIDNAEEQVLAYNIEEEPTDANILSMIMDLCDLAKEFKDNNDVEDSEILLCLQYIRRKRYNSDLWSRSAGEINKEFVEYVSNQNEELANYNFSKATIFDVVTNEEVDFAHLCATLNVVIYNDNTYSTLSNVAGWGGDLITLMKQVIEFDNNKTKEELLDFAKELLATNIPEKKSTFDIHDMLADVDAFNLYELGFFEDSNTDLYDEIEQYYYIDNDYSVKRFDYFAETLGGKDYIIENVKDIFDSIIGRTCIMIILDDENIQEKYIGNREKYIDIVSKVFSDYINEEINDLKIYSNQYELKTEEDYNYIKMINQYTKIADIVEYIKTNGEIEVYNKNNEQIEDFNTFVKTGIYLKITLSEKEEMYYAVIEGDINGDGEIKASDLSTLKSYLIGKKGLEGAFKEAADINYDGEIKASDLSRLKKVLISGDV